MPKDRESDFNRLQQILDENKGATARDIAVAQLASDFHKDLRQKELIEEIADFKAALRDTTTSIGNLKTAIDNFNTSSTKMYKALNLLTGIIALAAVVTVVLTLQH